MLCLTAIACALFAASEPDDVMMPMPDGVRLHTKIWKPGDGTYPVVFTRAYWPGFGRDHERFTEAGYVYVGQSTRGYAQSEGVMNRFFDDAKRLSQSRGCHFIACQARVQMRAQPNWSNPR